MIYLTTTPGFNGRVTTNATVNATYTTMTNIVDTAAASGGIDANQVNPLKTKWATVQNYLRAGNLKAASTALHDFATLVRSQSGKKIKKPTADALLAYAQTVYTSIGGQVITFDALANRHYGSQATVSATGTSTKPVTFTAGPPAVCTSGGTNGALISAVGLGQCTVTANQAGAGSLLLPATPVSRSFQATKAQIEIRPEPKTKVYGEANPEFTARFVLLGQAATLPRTSPALVTPRHRSTVDVGTYEMDGLGDLEPELRDRPTSAVALRHREGRS